MADNNKKRPGSFRKLFPNLFFSNKSKEKNKDVQGSLKSVTESSKCNQYQNPRSIRCDKNNQGIDDNERIYENLSTHGLHSDYETRSTVTSSHNSSTSTLVSESKRNISVETNESIDDKSIPYVSYSARPQVPPKPDSGPSPQSPSYSKKMIDPAQYPDVYYHSLEKLTHKISPLDEIEIYRASQAQANPASVGAEIKRVSTKFLISPKKEAEVRTIQPTRARSLSFDNQNDKNDKGDERSNLKSKSIKKPYNYSAPTSPMPINYKIPNMPKTVSPYEHVRKAMIETEEKRNSLSRSSARNKSTPSPRFEYSSQRHTVSPVVEVSKQDSIDREKARQKVEAFYWQKLRELKEKEDDYLIRHSLNSAMRKPMTPKSSNNCNTPNSFSYITEPKSSSLPRGKDIKSYNMNQPIYTSTPFMRGASERRTDTFIKSRTSYDAPEIIYRHPEKLLAKPPSIVQEQNMPIYQKQSTSLESQNVGEMKPVSFEDQYSQTGRVKSDCELKICDNQMLNRKEECKAVKVYESQSRMPPRPPIRTTSVRGAGQNIKIGNNKRITYITSAGYPMCSESESGSEAGEIQRILQSNAEKGKMFYYVGML